MRVQIHTPKGFKIIDTDLVTDAELAILDVTRETLDELAKPKRDLAAEIDALREEIELLKIKSKEVKNGKD